jgi:UDP-glucose 4-epimerase
LNNKNKYITIIGYSGYIGSLLRKKLSNEKNLKLIKSDYFYNNFIDLKKSHKKIIYNSKLIYFLTFNNDLKFAEKNPVLHYEHTVTPLKCLINVLESKQEITNIIYTSTVTVYGNTQSSQINENYPPKPLSVYDKHKLVCEKLLLDHSKFSKIRTNIFRLSNVYGESSGKSKSKNRGIVNNIIKSAIKGNKLTLYGDGNYLRDFIHIKDVIDLLIKLKKSNANNLIYNLCNGKSYTLIYLFKTIIKNIKKQKKIQTNLNMIKWPKNSMLIEKRSFKTSIKKIKKDFKWSPKISLKEGITNMISES